MELRRLSTVWEVPAQEIRAIEHLMQPIHTLTAEISDEEINSVIDEAVHEVRHERKIPDSLPLNS